jgi:nucleotide-binding universal stress UspA family protein
MPYRRILCATDFSADAGAALNRAVMVAKEHGASLEVLHVLAHESLDALRQWVPEPLAFGERLMGALRTQLESCAAEAAARAGVRIETRVVVGDVTQSISERAGSADLLVIGAHGTNPLKDFMIGTTAERLAGQCTTPILVVRVPPERPYSNVLVAVDLLPGSDSAMAAALEFAGAATLTAAHVFDVPFEGMLARAGVGQPVVDEHRLRAHQVALDKIAELSRSVSGEAIRFLAVVERGHPAATLVDQQRRTRADLVVIRKRVRSLVEALVLGSVTRHVLSDVASDVLVLTQPAR